MLPTKRLEQIHKGKKHKQALKSMEKHGHKSECWVIIDNVMVIFDEDDPPTWLADVLANRDDDGNTPEFYERQKQPA